MPNFYYPVNFLKNKLHTTRIEFHLTELQSGNQYSGNNMMNASERGKSTAWKIDANIFFLIERISQRKKKEQQQQQECIPMQCILCETSLAKSIVFCVPKHGHTINNKQCQ